MDGDEAQLKSYANDVLERFANHYIIHQLLSISLNSVSKFKTRDLPSLTGYIDKKGKLPKYLTFSIAALISFYNGSDFDGASLKGHRGNDVYEIKDDPEYLKTFEKLYGTKYDSVQSKAETIAHEVLSQESWWGQDLTKIAGLEDAVAKNLTAIYTDGVAKAIKSL